MNVVLFDDLVHAPGCVLQDVFTFLGVNANVEIQTGTIYSHSGKPKNAFISMLADRNNKFTFALRRAVMAMIPRPAIELAASKVLVKDLIPDEASQYLHDFFQADIRKLEPLIQKSLDHWVQT